MIRLLTASALAMIGAATAAARSDLHDLVDRHVGGPYSPRPPYQVSALFDQGSWCGYALPAHDARDAGFVGPLAPSDGINDLSARVGGFQVRAVKDEQPARVTSVRSWSEPGRLVEEIAGDGFAVTEQLFFADANTAIVRLRATLSPEVALQLDEATADGTHGTHPVDGAPSSFTVRSRRVKLPAATAEAKAVQEWAQLVTCQFADDHADASSRSLKDWTAHDVQVASRSRDARWAAYLARTRASVRPEWRYGAAFRWPVTMVETLLGNWRVPRGDLTAAGVLPSASNPDYDGFWAWDSWKHAAALAAIAPDLATSQIRVMLAAQRTDGMIPDVIYPDHRANNERNSKPPLTAWAVEAVFAATHDRAFLNEVLPRLESYHRWWWTARSDGAQGLAAFGSTDGTAEAARWESGMDNAVRFEEATLVAHGAGQWAFDQASVDLNAYLMADAAILARLSEILGRRAAARAWQQEADRLRTALTTQLFDRSVGFFRDRRADNGAFVPHDGAEGFIPLWAGAATPAQAAAVARRLSDPAHFQTYYPYPTLDCADAAFDPEHGYWRGPVWIDQAWFALEGLKRYGYRAQARRGIDHLLHRAQGLAQGAPVYENYDPLTGRGINAPNFSWSAAHFLLMMQTPRQVP